LSLKLDLLKLLIPSNKIGGALKLGGEDQLCVEFAQYLREQTLQKDFPYIWFHVPNQFAMNRPLFGLKQSWMGRISGIPDYIFIGKHSFMMEFKSGKGKLSPNQKIVQQWAEKVNIPLYVVNNLKEAQDIVTKEWSKIKFDNS